eukprot:scaffold155557_cov15-Prasinocladus_malaysianus.AAC.1
MRYSDYSWDSLSYLVGSCWRSYRVKPGPFVICGPFSVECGRGVRKFCVLLRSEDDGGLLLLFIKSTADETGCHYDYDYDTDYHVPSYRSSSDKYNENETTMLTCNASENSYSYLGLFSYEYCVNIPFT